MKPLRTFIIGLTLTAVATPGVFAANSGFSCSQIPDAQRYLDHLQPGPNTSAAQSHLDAAKHAQTNAECIAQLREVDKYARRSAAADRRHVAVQRHRHHHVLCADALHEDRPGGTDYHGPRVAGCP